MCNCIEQVEKYLMENTKNTKLDVPITFSSNILEARRVAVSVCKRDEKKRDKPTLLFAAFCPFCGKAYEEKRTGVEK